MMDMKEDNENKKMYVDMTLGTSFLFRFIYKQSRFWYWVYAILVSFSKKILVSCLSI